MIKRIIIFFLLWAFMIPGAMGQSVQSLLDSANHHYADGRYQQAIGLYEQVLAQGKEAPGVYYNLGNAYYKTNQLAEAILNYERARLRDPGNEDIRYNLGLARQQVTDRIEKIPDFFLTRWTRQFINLLSSNQWAVISMVAFILFLIFFSIYLYTRRMRLKKSSFWISLLAVAIAAAAWFFAFQQKKDVIHSQEAIVFDPKVTVRSSPDESGTELFVIHEGTKVHLEDSVSGWYEITLPDGSKGWLSRESIQPI
jgi:tetratricopeptide (TPR) repeat protein